MPNFILKPEPDVDQYVLWSAITEVPYFVGTRDECKAKLTRWNEGEDAAADERFDRADRSGTSSVEGLDGWDDGKTTGSVIVEQRGLVQLKDLPEVFRCMEAKRPYDHVVTPFEKD
jgi:hypothetical protein